MAQQLKTKNINVVPGPLFCRLCKAKFLHQDRLTVLMIKMRFSLLQILNELTEFHIRRKKLQSIGISPVSLHAFKKTLKSDISKAYKVQVDCLRFHGLILMMNMT